MGIGGVALTWLLQREGLLAKPVKPEFVAHDLLPKRPSSRASGQGYDLALHAGWAKPDGSV